jgi:hypothetical protein
MKILQFVVASFLIANMSYTQVITTAVPFLMVSTSPEGNGMAGISSSVITSDPFAMMANPGQVGFQSLSEHFGGATYTNKASWLPAFNLSDVYFSVQSALVGTSLRDFTSFPLNLSAGFGYSKTYLNLGQFATTSGDPTILQTFHGYEQCDAFTAGMGIEYGVRLGIGITTKKVESFLGTASATAQASDFGAILNVPVATLVDVFSDGNETGFRPKFDVNLSYGRSNVGGSIYYIDPSQDDPLPRLATLGASTELGLMYRIGETDWNLLSLSIAREASDLLIWKDQVGRFSYKHGSGNLSFVKNLIRGLGSENLNVRKGFRVAILEAAYIERGSFDEPGLSYSTVGYGMRLSGILKAIMLADPRLVESSSVGFILGHIDLQYSNSWYQSGESPIAGTTFSGLALIIK